MGSKHPTNPFVSTTRSLESVRFFATHGEVKPPGIIAVIDLSKVTQPILDVSTPATASTVLHHPRAINFAVKRLCTKTLVFPHLAVQLGILHKKYGTTIESGEVDWLAFLRYNLKNPIVHYGFI